METPAEDIPAGWTNKPALLEMFFHHRSAEAYLAQLHGIDNAELLLMTTPESGNMGYIITSGGRFYCGDLMIDYIFEITKPKTWPAILRTLATGGERALRMKRLRPVREVEEYEEEMVDEGPDLFVPPPDPPADVPSTSERQEQSVHIDQRLDDLPQGIRGNHSAQRAEQDDDELSLVPAVQRLQIDTAQGPADIFRQRPLTACPSPQP